MRRMLGAVFLLILMTGCGPIKSIIKPDFTLRGEVFVVTNGAQNIRLGRLDVMVYDPAVIENYIALKKAEYEKLGSGYSQDMQYFLENEPQLSKDIQDAQEHADRRHGTWDQEKTEKAVKDAEDRRQNAQVRANKAQTQFDELQSGRPFFANLPASLVTAKTDSEGKYQIPVPKNKPYVVVSAGTYSDTALVWVVKMPATMDDSVSLTLSNDNRANMRYGVPMLP